MLNYRYQQTIPPSVLSNDMVLSHNISFNQTCSINNIGLGGNYIEFPESEDSCQDILDRISANVYAGNNLSLGLIRGFCSVYNDHLADRHPNVTTSQASTPNHFIQNAKKIPSMIYNIVDSWFLTGNNDLHRAVLSSDFSFIKQYDKSEIDPYAVNFDGFTPFHLACKIGNTKAIKAFLKQDYDIDTLNQNGEHPVEIAVRNEMFTTAKLLMASEPNLDNSNSSLIHICAREGYLEGVKQSLKIGESLDARNSYNETPLIAAIKQLRLVKLSIKEVNKLTETISFLIKKPNKLFFKSPPITSLDAKIVSENLRRHPKILNIVNNNGYSLFNIFEGSMFEIYSGKVSQRIAEIEDYQKSAFESVVELLSQKFSDQLNILHIDNLSTRRPNTVLVQENLSKLAKRINPQTNYWGSNFLGVDLDGLLKKGLKSSISMTKSLYKSLFRRANDKNEELNNRAFVFLGGKKGDFWMPYGTELIIESPGVQNKALLNFCKAQIIQKTFKVGAPVSKLVIDEKGRLLIGTSVFPEHNKKHFLNKSKLKEVVRSTLAAVYLGNKINLGFENEEKGSRIVIRELNSEKRFEKPLECLFEIQSAISKFMNGGLLKDSVFYTHKTDIDLELDNQLDLYNKNFNHEVLNNLEESIGYLRSIYNYQGDFDKKIRFLHETHMSAQRDLENSFELFSDMRRLLQRTLHGGKSKPVIPLAHNVQIAEKGKVKANPKKRKQTVIF